MTRKIAKTVDLKATPARAWRALTDHEEFGAWFRVRLDGPFKEGEVSTGNISYPGYEHLKWHATVQQMGTEKLLAFTRHPGAGGNEPD